MRAVGVQGAEDEAVPATFDVPLSTFSNALIFFLVAGPKIPVPLVRPLGLKTSDL